VRGRRSEVLKERKRPGLKSSNAARVKRAKVFSQGEWKVLLNIPKCIDDYNHHMGGVDIVADQYWSYYDTQLISQRTWFPIFFWLLDTALINSFIMYSDLGISLEHKEFRIQVAWSLLLSFVERGGVRRNHNTSTPKPPPDIPPNDTPQHYITQRSGFPPPVPDGQHFPIQLPQKRHCVFCRWQRAQEGSPGVCKPTQAPQKIWECGTCHHALCLNDKRNCFYMYHNYEE